MTYDEEYAQLIQRQEIQNKEIHRSALKHWFSKETSIKPQAWPTLHDQSAKTTNLPCPPGIDSSYWENLSKIEQNWASRQDATAVPSLEERRQLWQQEASLRAVKDNKPKEADFFTQALTPADPFEEPIKRKARLLRGKAEQNVVALKPHQLLWQIAVNE